MHVPASFWVERLISVQVCPNKDGNQFFWWPTTPFFCTALNWTNKVAHGAGLASRQTLLLGWFKCALVPWACLVPHAVCASSWTSTTSIEWVVRNCIKEPRAATNVLNCCLVNESRQQVEDTKSFHALNKEKISAENFLKYRIMWSVRSKWDSLLSPQTGNQVVRTGKQSSNQSLHFETFLANTEDFHAFPLIFRMLPS